MLLRPEDKLEYMPLLYSGLWLYQFSPQANAYLAKPSISTRFDNTDLYVRVWLDLPMKAVMGQKGHRSTGEGGETSSRQVTGREKCHLLSLLMFWVALNKLRLCQWVAGEECLFCEICHFACTFVFLHINQSLNIHRWPDQFILRYHKPSYTVIQFCAALNLHTSIFFSSWSKFQGCDIVKSTLFSFAIHCF